MLWSSFCVDAGVPEVAAVALVLWLLRVYELVGGVLLSAVLPQNCFRVTSEIEIHMMSNILFTIDLHHVA